MLPTRSEDVLKLIDRQYGVADQRAYHNALWLKTTEGSEASVQKFKGKKYRVLLRNAMGGRNGKLESIKGFGEMASLLDAGEQPLNQHPALLLGASLLDLGSAFFVK